MVKITPKLNKNFKPKHNILIERNSTRKNVFKNPPESPPKYFVVTNPNNINLKLIKIKKDPQENCIKNLFNNSSPNKRENLKRNFLKKFGEDKEILEPNVNSFIEVEDRFAKLLSQTTKRLQDLNKINKFKKNPQINSIKNLLNNSAPNDSTKGKILKNIFSKNLAKRRVVD